MTTPTPIERVIDILQRAGYRRLELPMTIASVPFDFAAALVGTGRSPDLIVVVDTIQDSEARTRQKIDALGRAMDLIGSRRPVTAVLAGPRPAHPTLDALGRICRVLPIGTPTGEDAESLLHDWLSVLLPLELPDLGDANADSMAELTVHLPELEPEFLERLMVSARSGEDAVREAVRALIEEQLDDEAPEAEAAL